MTRNYIYIEAGREIDYSTRFFRVAVGTNMQANRDFLFLLAYATNHNYFFEIDSNEVSNYLHRIAKSLYGDCGVMTLMKLDIQHVKLRDLVRAIKNSSKLSTNPTTRTNSEHQKDMLDSAYYSMKKLARNLNLPSESTYKNQK